MSEEDLGNTGDSDEAILNHMINGPEDEKAEADHLMAAALREEGATGAGDERPEKLTDGDQEEADAENEKPEAEEKPKEPIETDSQRRRRLRRESAQRTQRERDEYRKKAEKLQAKLDTLQSKIPDPSRYGDDQVTYMADRSAIAAQHAIVSEDLEAANAEAERADFAARELDYQKQEDFMSEGDSKYKGFSEKLKGNLPFTPAMAEVLQDDSMIDLAWELAHKPSEVARIANLSNPIQQVKEIIKMQAALDAKAAEVHRSKAPDPIKPVKPNSSPNKRPKDMSMAEYYKYRQNQINSAR